MNICFFLIMILCSAFISNVMAEQTNTMAISKVNDTYAKRSAPTTEKNNMDIFSQKKTRPWYKKLHYFAYLSQDYRQLRLYRQSENEAINNSTLFADYHGNLLSFTLGGNLLKNTSIHFDVAYNPFTLAGQIVEENHLGFQQIEAIKFTRDKVLTELFVEYDLSSGATLGGDVYFAYNPYHEGENNKRYRDKEYGANIFASKRYPFNQSSLKFDYILSHRVVNPGNNNFSTIKNTFHNLLTVFRYPLDSSKTIEVIGRFSYYPNVDTKSFWESRYLYSLASQVAFQVNNNVLLNLRAELSRYSDQSQVNSLSINLEYYFGKSKTKRRIRRRKVPQLLIR